MRCERFRCCGGNPWLEASADDLRIRADYCRDRWCQTCQRRAVAAVRLELAKKWKPGRIRFITLTLKHTATPLAAQVKALRKHFQELRRSKEWKRHVDGGAAFMEIKVGNDALWHPHIHIICDGLFWDKEELRRLWQSITLHSYIVDIRAADDEQEVVHYLTKYVTKPAHQNVMKDPEKLDEAIMSIKGVRVMSSFGTWKGMKLRDKPMEVDDTKWKAIGRVDAILMQRDEESRRWREAAIRKWPRLQLLFPWASPAAGPDPPGEEYLP